MRLLALLLALPLIASGASLDFAETSKEIHTDATEREIEIDFPFTNNSDEAVEIVKYDGYCSCIGVRTLEKKRVYQPGEKGTIRASFDLGTFRGEVNKRIDLWLNDDPVDKASISLKTKIHIPVLVQVEPKTLRWNTGDEPQTNVLTVHMDHKEPIHILSATVATGPFEVELKEIEKGKKYEIHVTPTSTDKPAISVIRIETDSPVKRHAIQQAFAVIRKSK